MHICLIRCVPLDQNLPARLQVADLTLEVCPPPTSKYVLSRDGLQLFGAQVRDEGWREHLDGRVGSCNQVIVGGLLANVVSESFPGDLVVRLQDVMEITDSVLRVTQRVTMDHAGDSDDRAVRRVVESLLLHLFFHALLTAEWRVLSASKSPRKGSPPTIFQGYRKSNGSL